MTTAIKVERLAKSYLVGHNAAQAEGYTALRDVIARSAKTLARKTRDMLAGRPIVQGDEVEEFWALKDINFEIKQGARVGIIGRNGAGKSTLLKILSRITEPTAGRVTINGRVASLLEVGTGFHPELTGRENIFLNGAILGMSRREIQRKFDQIVDFAEVEKFLDTPVKRYSSGMYVRLAFAVAAHLEPEILIVDEVLAVGDAQFQKKCLGKMEDVANEGRTILFVSHNFLAVQKLCRECILLDKGSISLASETSKVIETYFSTSNSHAFIRQPFADVPQIRRVTIENEVVVTSDPLLIKVEWYLPERIRGLKVGVGVNTVDGQRIFDTCPEDYGQRTPDSAGPHSATLTIPANSLIGRNYLLSAGIWSSGGSIDHVMPAIRFNVSPAPVGPYGHQSTRDGFVNIDCTWTVSEE